MSHKLIKRSNGKHEYVDFGVSEYMIDGPDDVSQLPEDCAPGSMAYTADLTYIAMKNLKGEWVQTV